MENASPTNLRRKSIHAIVLIYFRFVSIMTIFYGVGYWMMIMGISDPLIRFDLMENPWRIVAAILCVLMPVASLGLWGMQRWGFAIWLMAILVEFYAYFLMSDYYGNKPAILMFHACSVTVLLIYQVARMWEASQTTPANQS